MSIPNSRPVVLAIGTFDGVHLAHQALLDDVVRRARSIDGLAAVLTFRNHPRAIVSPENCPPLLTSWEAKKDLILGRGVDVVTGLLFDPGFAATPAERFVEEVISGIFHAHTVIGGPAFHFGQGRRGNSELLMKLSDRHGYLYVPYEPVHFDGEKVSSTRIRQTLARGEVAAAERLLTRPHSNRGIVVEGDRLGRKIGFPTANLQMHSGEFVPADGVYAVQVNFGGHAPWPGIMNIGNRPTVNGKEHRKEVHIIGFDDDLVGVELEVLYRHRLRDEVRFDGIDALKSQLNCDRDDALAALQA